MPTIPQRSARAFAVLWGQDGDVTPMAQDRERSRPSLDREAEQVANAGDGAAAQARIDELQPRLAQRQAEVHALPDRLRHAVAITPNNQDEFATVAQAEGVSSSVARRLLRVVAGSESPPRGAPRGRATLEAGQHAGPSLKLLDEAARPTVQQGTADAISGAQDRSGGSSSPRASVGGRVGWSSRATASPGPKNAPDFRPSRRWSATTVQAWVKG